MNNRQITKMTIEGFKSIKYAQLDLSMINVFIGANGAGKSNLISVFKLLQNLIDENLQLYVTQQGGPDRLLHFGRKTTEFISISFEFGHNGYSFKLSPTQDNRLMFEEENFFWDKSGAKSLARGHVESMWRKGLGNGIDRFILPILENQNWRVYHFHDTSESASVKQFCNINDNAYFAHDARNLAAFLFRLSITERKNYNQIKDAVKLVAPYFDDFVLRENPFRPDMVQLEWRDVHSDTIFNASQLSDGTLRFICLATLFLQPESLQPDTILLDEPELGLHPYAIVLLAGLIKKTSIKKQIILSTQSVELLNEFSTEDIIVVNHKNAQTEFKRLDRDNLKVWLEDDFSLGDLWKSNLLGGRP